jgi:hypothetical protein
MSRWKTVLCGRLLLWATKLGKLTIRWRFSGMDKLDELIRQGRPIVFAGWHGHNYLTLLAYYVHVRKRVRATIFVPASPNGRIMAYFGERAHLDVIRVGTEMGPLQWAKAAVATIRQLRNGSCALISPDGPEGPAFVAKPGVAVIGQQAKAVIVPASATSRPGFKLGKRWDEHWVPFPFSRAVIHFGDPIDTHPEDGPIPTTEEIRERVEAALQEGARRVEALCREAGPGLARLPW